MYWEALLTGLMAGFMAGYFVALAVEDYKKEKETKTNNDPSSAEMGSR